MFYDITRIIGPKNKLQQSNPNIFAEMKLTLKSKGQKKWRRREEKVMAQPKFQRQLN
jgi:hypothetical protein